MRRIKRGTGGGGAVGGTKCAIMTGYTEKFAVLKVSRQCLARPSGKG